MFFNYIACFIRLPSKAMALLRGSRLKEVKVLKDTVFITGCDSGIGLCFAEYLASVGCVVFAGVLSEQSEGAKKLKGFKGKGEIFVVEIDVTDKEKVIKCVEEVEKGILRRNLELSAVINNAGVMVFGEFEWQTDEQVERQFNVNVIGYMRVAKAFAHILRKHQGRLVNVTSHCSMTPLPCLSVYSATKSALEAWSSALAIEMFKFNVPVITIHPGSYFQESNILKRHNEDREAMWREMSDELRQTSKGYFNPVMDYMGLVRSPRPIQDPVLISLIQSAVFSKKPALTYVNSPWRYYVFYGLISAFKPFWGIRRKLVLSFMSLPKYK